MLVDNSQLHRFLPISGTFRARTGFGCITPAAVIVRVANTLPGKIIPGPGATIDYIAGWLEDICV